MPKTSLSEDIMSDIELAAVSDEIYIGIQRFFYQEAGLLDRRQYREWLSILTDDVHYRVTAAVSRDTSASPVDYAIVDEGMTGLKSRVEQISNPRLTRAENPPSMMRRVVTNIEAHYTKNESEFSATSYLLAHRLRPSAPEGGFYVAVRHDTLRRNGPDWRIAQRTVCLDQIMLFDGALSTLL